MISLHVRCELSLRQGKVTPPPWTLQLSFIAVFTFARLVVGPYVVYETLKAQSPFAVKVFITSGPNLRF